MPQSNPLISVIIPSYNHARFITAAIESVLAQTYAPLELIVIDDGSTDDSMAVIECYQDQLHCIKQLNCGTGATRNRGVSVASGSYLAFLDSDDIWLPEKLAQQVAMFVAKPETDVVFGHAEQFFDDSVTVDVRQRIRNKIGRIPATMPSAMLTKRACFEAVGPFTTKTIADIDWYTRLMRSDANVAMLSEVVFRRRIHLTNATRLNRATVRREYLQIIRTHLNSTHLSTHINKARHRGTLSHN